jgi:hypothetical protein
MNEIERKERKKERKKENKYITNVTINYICEIKNSIRIDRGEFCLSKCYL